MHGVAPAGVAGGHEDFEAGDCRGHDGVVELGLGPNARIDGVEGPVLREKLCMKVMQAEDNEGDDTAGEVSNRLRQCSSGLKRTGAWTQKLIR